MNEKKKKVKSITAHLEKYVYCANDHHNRLLRFQQTHHNAR